MGGLQHRVSPHRQATAMMRLMAYVTIHIFAERKKVLDKQDM